MTALEKLLEAAEVEIGYLEKKSNEQLENPTANAGDAKYTKYTRDLYPDSEPGSWCNVFVHWCFFKAFGAETADLLLCDYLKPLTSASAGYYREEGLYFSTPKIGDIVFFKDSAGIYHTGIVYDFDSTTVYTVEGDIYAASDSSHKGVCYKEHLLTEHKIDGYARPNWRMLPAGNVLVSNYNGQMFIHLNSKYYYNQSFNLIETLTKEVIQP